MKKEPLGLIHTSITAKCTDIENIFKETQWL